MLHLQVEAELIHDLALLKPCFAAWIEKWLPKVRDGVNGVGAGKGCGQLVRVVEIIADHFDATGCERLGSGFGSIAGEAADAPFWLVEKDIGSRSARAGLMS